MQAHDIAQASPWVERFVRLIPAGGEVLDLACGGGRHSRLLAGLGYRVEAVDRDAAALAGLSGVEGIHVRQADLESGPWPYAGHGFDGVVVTNYLHRPLLPQLLDVLAPGGVLIYETFTQGNEVFGKPSNPDFLLRPHELIEWVCPRLTVVAFEQGRTDSPRLAVIQRLCAVNKAVSDLP